MKPSLSGLGLGALVLVNAVAFVAVEKHFHVTADASPTSSAGGLSTATSPASSEASPTTSPSSSALSADPVRSPEVFVIAASGNRAWRAVNSGDCHGSVTIQATTDGGRTWSNQTTSPAGAVDGIALNGQGRLQLSGQAASNCAQRVWALEGGSWSAATSASWVSGGLHAGTVLHDGHAKKACEHGSVIDIAVAGDTADVLCSTGEVRAVPADGAAKTIYQSADALSIGTTGDNTLIVARTAKGCDGVQVAKVTHGSAQPITCVAGASKKVDLTFAGDNGWLVAAHNTWTGKASGDWSKS